MRRVHFAFVELRFLRLNNVVVVTSERLQAAVDEWITCRCAPRRIHVTVGWRRNLCKQKVCEKIEQKVKQNSVGWM